MVLHCQQLQQRVELGTIADFLTCFCGVFLHVMSTDMNVSRTAPSFPYQALQGGGFASAVVPQQTEDFSCLHAEGDAFHCMLHASCAAQNRSVSLMK
eukprot:CAMPEP_0206633704 /NCGR_PEP_ID=MMETSP0325_2-20121206/69637_1 /ASSEMBLY_ACC=CAM_ASM_000347 /TAXON_ID=2866 /ORGANISM="Crypthecodinium cohnii, Strain Seligo" /LENGTH=96 /DNA_ID=CAMNT_0054159425 /DNA_START=752 /DNA_END=1042 /DNA_ORIENTATION=-